VQKSAVYVESRQFDGGRADIHTKPDECHCGEDTTNRASAARRSRPAGRLAALGRAFWLVLRRAKAHKDSEPSIRKTALCFFFTVDESQGRRTWHGMASGWLRLKDGAHQ
jgi:hypothetical protein